MNELIRINNENGTRPTVSGRDLHGALKINTKYSDWFKRMCDYGFEEDKDYIAVSQKWETAQGNTTTQIDHEITIQMAKEICMIQRSDKGRKFRQYFIKVEEAWNTPEAVMARALQVANQTLAEIKDKNVELESEIQELKPKASYYDTALQSDSLISITAIAKDLGMSGKKLNEILHNLGVQYKKGKMWFLYQDYADKGYTQSKTHLLDAKKSVMSMYWTQKGRQFIYELLKARLGIKSIGGTI